MSGSKTISTSETKLEALRFQSSAYGIPIAVVWGVTRIPGNLLWYGGFKSIAHTETQEAGGKGGGVKTQNTSFTYEAAMALALGEGTISAIPRVWRGKNTYTDGTTTALAQVGLTLVTGTMGQPVWSHLTTNAPTQALAYAGIAYVRASAYDLGTSAAVENHTFEVVSNNAYHLGPLVPDVDASLIGNDLLLNARYGVRGFQASKIGSLTSWSNYCRAAGLLLSPALTTQQPAADVLKELLRLTNTGPVWSGGVLKFVPYGDETVTGNGATYTPNVTPIYDLTLDHFLNKSQPVRQRRKPKDDAYNHIRVEYQDRENQYSVSIAEARDQADIDVYGLRSADVLRAHWVADRAVARNIAQILLQRSVNIRSTYLFELPWNYVALEPMDIVTLTEPSIGLDKLPVRLVSVSEDEGGELAFEAEIFPSGAASASLYPSQSGVGFSHLYNAAPGNASIPVIFEAPGALTQSGLEVWVAATGLGSNWGGCSVWVSLSGTNYRKVGTIDGGSRLGTLSAAAGASGGMSVTLQKGVLGSGTAAEAAALATLCFVRGAAEEFLSYETATLTGALAYTLGGTVVRGVYGTAGAAHASGSGFVRLDGAIAKSGPIDNAYIGKTISIKLTSFNIFRGGEQTLADVPAYTYTVTGARIYGNAGYLALQGVTDAASDSILSPSEKPPIILDWSRATSEQGGLESQANAYGITTEKTAYTASMTAMYALFDGLQTPFPWNDLTGSTTFNGIVFRAEWAALYTARQNLLNKIDAAAGTRADWTSIDQKPADSELLNLQGTYSVIRAWNFQDTTEGCVAQFANLAVNPNSVQLGSIAGNSNPILFTNGSLGISGANFTKVRARLRRLGGAGWQGTVYYTTDGHGISEGYTKTVPDPAPGGQWVVVEWDMAALTSGGADWTTSTIQQLRFDLGNSDGDAFEIDWLAVGTTGPASYGAIWGQNVVGSATVDSNITTAQTAANNAATAASTAQTSANNALSDLQAIASDGVLHRSEKPAAILDWYEIDGTYPAIDAQAAAYGITAERAAYTTAKTNLANYLSGLSPGWADTYQNTTIVPAVWRTYWNDCYQARQALLNKIAAVAATLSSWAGTSGKPANVAGLQGTESIRNDALASAANLVFDGDFTLGSSAWYFTRSNVVQAIDMFGINLSADWILNSTPGQSQNVLFLHQADSTGDVSMYTEVVSQPIPLSANTRYCVSAYTGAHRCKVAVFVYTYNDSGVVSNSYAGADVENNMEATGGRTLGSFKRTFSFIDTGASGAGWARVVLRKYSTSVVGLDSWMFATQAMFEVVGATATQPGPWSLGPSGSKFGSNIYGQAGTADIASDAVTYVQEVKLAGSHDVYGTNNTAVKLLSTLYTPPVNCKVILTIMFDYVQLGSTDPDPAGYNILCRDPAQMALPLKGSHMYTGTWRTVRTLDGNISDKRAVTLTAGVQYEFAITFDTIEPWGIRVFNPVLVYEVIKR